MSHILAIDQGTSATKCVLVDDQGRIVRKATAALGERYPEAGWVEQDPEAVWRSLLDAVRGCLEQQPAVRIAAVGLSNQRESALIWRRADARPLTPLLSWQDRRTVSLQEQLIGQGHGPEVLERTGLPLDPMFSALKIRWLLDQIDADRQQSRSGAWVAGTIDAWLMERMGAQGGIEVGNASRTQLLNVRTGQWDPALLALFEVPAALMPAVVPSVGRRTDAGQLHPMLAGVPVCAVMADSHAALFAHGVREAGALKATMGTGSSVMGLARPGAERVPGVCLTIAWDAGAGPRLAHEGNIRSAGATLRWAADLFGIDLDAAFSEAARGSAGKLCLVPAFSGLGAPYWDAQAVGLMAGLTLSSDRPQVLAAALDSIAHQVADVVQAIRAGGDEVHKLLLDGGPSRNAVLREAIAAYLQRPVVHCLDPELSALGVAHLAGLACGLWDESGLQRLAREQVTTPVPQRGQAEVAMARQHWADAVARARLPAHAG